MAQLNGVIYVVCCDSSAVHAFSGSRRLADIDVEGLRDATDMAACVDTGQLYIVDNCCCVWRVRPTDRQVVR